jgi:tRNA (Thr-GGU) A37 N-methylase
MARTVPVPAIGVVRTGRTSLEDTPIQAALNRAEHGAIWIEPRYQEGLVGLEGFEYAWLLTWLDRPSASEDPPALRQTPFLLRGTDQKIGVFATRGPRRVNPIGLSLIEVLSVDGTRVDFAGVDLIDGTQCTLTPGRQRRSGRIRDSSSTGPLSPTNSIRPPAMPSSPPRSPTLLAWPIRALYAV